MLLLFYSGRRGESESKSLMLEYLYDFAQVTRDALLLSDVVNAWKRMHHVYLLKFGTTVSCTQGNVSSRISGGSLH